MEVPTDTSLRYEQITHPQDSYFKLFSAQLTPTPDIVRVFEGYCLGQTAAAVTPTDNKAAKLFLQADRPQQEMKCCHELKMSNASSLMNKNMNLFGLQCMHAFLIN